MQLSSGSIRKPPTANAQSRRMRLKLAEKESARLAQIRPTAPEMMVTLGDYFARVYLPFAESKLRFATAHNYGIMGGSILPPARILPASCFVTFALRTFMHGWAR